MKGVDVMVRIPKDVIESLGRTEGRYIYYDGWKYEVMTFDDRKNEYITIPIGKINSVA